MSTFLQRFGAFIAGVLCGYDRIRFRGTKRQLCYPNGIMGFLQSRNVRIKDFKDYSLAVTESLFRAIEPPAKEAGIYRYLGSNRVGPEDVAREIAAEHGRTTGLIAVLGRVEPCQTIKFHRAANGWAMPRLASGAKCLHYYHYYLDPMFGLRYTRLQSWFPFTMHVGLNGREWLARQMAAAGVGFVQRDNCFTQLDDPAAAQALADAQLASIGPVNWTCGRPRATHWPVHCSIARSPITGRSKRRSTRPTSCSGRPRISPGCIQPGFNTRTAECPAATCSDT